MIAASPLSPEDLAVDHELADIVSFRFLLGLTSIDVTSAQAPFERDGLAPRFEGRPLEEGLAS